MTSDSPRITKHSRTFYFSLGVVSGVTVVVTQSKHWCSCWYQCVVTQSKPWFSYLRKCI